MEFEGQYLTYEEYKALGGTLDLMSFNLLEFEARNQIDLRTQNRLVGIDVYEVPQKVKICVYNLIDRIDSYIKITEQTSKAGSIASETTDGYSVSYVNNSQVSEVVKSKNQEFEDMIISGLYGVIYNGEHIIYIGVK